MARVRRVAGTEVVLNAPDENLQAACCRLADYLQSRKDQLISEWIAAVQSDADVPSETMTPPEIRDHLPDIFDAIIQTIRNECGDAEAAQVQHLAARHTIVRWIQQYDLGAVIRELSLLRVALIRHMCAFEGESPGFSNEARLFSSTAIHRVIDDIAMDATETYLSLVKSNGG